MYGPRESHGIDFIAWMRGPCVPQSPFDATPAISRKFGPVSLILSLVEHARRNEMRSSIGSGGGSVRGDGGGDFL